MLFKIVDGLVATLPKIFGNIIHRVDPGNIFVQDIFGIYACDQYILIMGAVEYAKLTPLRQGDIVSPNIIVLQLFAGRSFEAVYNDATCIEFLENLPNERILSRSVHALHANQYAIFTMCIHDVLQLSELFPCFLYFFSSFLLRQFLDDIGEKCRQLAILTCTKTLL